MEDMPIPFEMQWPILRSRIGCLYTIRMITQTQILTHCLDAGWRDYKPCEKSGNERCAKGLVPAGVLLDLGVQMTAAEDRQRSKNQVDGENCPSRKDGPPSTLGSLSNTSVPPYIPI